MDPKDFDTFMRRVASHISNLEDRVAALEELESLAVPAYEDIQVSISEFRRPVSNAPTWRSWNYGIGGGVNFSILGFAVNDNVDLFIQSSHKMTLQSILDYHIHWSIPSNSSGSRIQVQVDAIAAGVNGSFDVVSGSPFTVETVLAGSESGKHNILDLADIDGVNDTVSTAYILKLTRIAATSSEYSGELYIVFSDGHYMIDALGSREEYSK